MFKVYHVRLELEDKLAAGLPQDPEKLLSFLTAKAPKTKPEDAIPLEDLAESIEVYTSDDLGEQTEEGITTTFCMKDGRPVWEARTLKSHFKDCASKLAVYWDMPRAKSTVANRIVFRPDYIDILDRDGNLVTEPSGKDIRPVTISDRIGKRTAVKIVTYIERPVLEFELHVLNDGQLTKQMLEDLLRYGGTVNGLGQDRTIGLGKYTFTLTEA